MPFPPMPGPPSSPIEPFAILIRVKDTKDGAYVAGARAFGVDETDGGSDRVPFTTAADGSVIVNAANIGDWTVTDNNLIHIELTKGYRAARIYEKISKATRAARYAAYPLIAELREEGAEHIGIVGSAVVGRTIITRNKQ